MDTARDQLNKELLPALNAIHEAQKAIKNAFMKVYGDKLRNIHYNGDLLGRISRRLQLRQGCNLTGIYIEVGENKLHGTGKYVNVALEGRNEIGERFTLHLGDRPQSIAADETLSFWTHVFDICVQIIEP